jgi:PD-(D/E)XK nuclease superfamily
MMTSVLISLEPTGRFKIPNREVMMDWARWITGGISSYTDILDICVGGHISTFEERWPIFMQQHLDPKTVAKARGAVSLKTPESIYHVYFLGLMHILRPKGWEVSIEARAGGGYIDIRLISRKKGSAVLIELKSSKKPEHIDRDAGKALQQIVDKNYRNQEGLPNIRILREYGIASYHLDSCVKGQYLELDTQSRWVEKEDPAIRI